MESPNKWEEYKSEWERQQSEAKDKARENRIIYEAALILAKQYLSTDPEGKKLLKTRIREAEDALMSRVRAGSITPEKLDKLLGDARKNAEDGLARQYVEKFKPLLKKIFEEYKKELEGVEDDKKPDVLVRLYNERYRLGRQLEEGV